MKTTKIAITALAALLTMSGCRKPVTLYYLKDMEPDTLYRCELQHEPTVMINDRLDITVSCKNPELAVPFNTTTGSVTMANDASVQGNEVASTTVKPGYRVESDGRINFPVLGRLHVKDLKLSEVEELIAREIIDGGYIRDPEVTAHILNFHYTIIGSAGSGIYNVDDDKINLIDAIARSGDVGSDARMDRVGVIREEADGRKLYMHDLGSKDVFTSPCFYLQQNDIIYVEPQKKKNDYTSRVLQFMTVGLSLVSAITSILVLTKK